MRTAVMFPVVSLVIVAMSGIIDDAANDTWNVTGCYASNGTNVTLEQGL